MDQALAEGGQDARNRVQQQLLELETSDARAGLDFVRALPEVDRHRIAAVGHSFGGSLTLMLAERDSSIRAVAVFSAAGESWDRSPELRARLMAAVEDMAPAVFFINAKNDYSIGAAETLSAELTRLGKPSLLKVYPPVGRTSRDGHEFVHFGIATWEPDLFAFLDEYTK